MKVKPLVSVVIPMYNAEKYIKDTLLSLKNQTYNNYEVILVDNASTDDSLFIAKDMSVHFNSFVIIESEFNSGGPAKPRNIGINVASGDYIAFLDSDDLWEPEKLAVQILYMEDNSIQFSSTDRNVFKISVEQVVAESISQRFKKYVFKKLFSIKILMTVNNIFTSSVIIRRDILLEGFDEDSVLNTVEDFYLWISLVDRGIKYHFIDEKLLNYRILSNSLSSKNSLSKNKAKNSYAILRYIIKNNAFHLYYFFKVRQLLRFLGL